MSTSAPIQEDVTVVTFAFINLIKVTKRGDKVQLTCEQYLTETIGLVCIKKVFSF